jgi:hypothetical protein
MKTEVGTNPTLPPTSGVLNVAGRQAGRQERHTETHNVLGAEAHHIV